MPTTRELRAEGRERKIARKRANWLYLWNAREHLAQKRYQSVKRWRGRNQAKSRLWDQVQKSNWKARGRGDKNRLTYEDWQAVLSICGERCCSCGGTDHLTIDHVIPTSRGGLNHPANLQPLCSACNSSKHDRPECDFRTDEQRLQIHDRFSACPVLAS